MEAKQCAPLVNMHTFWNHLWSTMRCGGYSGDSLCVICNLLRCPEAKELWMMISRRWSGKKKKIVVDAEEARGV